MEDKYMKKTLTALLTAATIAAPLNANAKVYTTKQLGYGNNFVISETKNHKTIAYIKKYGSCNGKLLKYHDGKYISSYDGDYIKFSNRTKTIKLNKNTRFYQWKNYTPTQTNVYSRTKNQFIRFCNSHEFSQLRFKSKKGYATTIIYGPQAWS